MKRKITAVAALAACAALPSLAFAYQTKPSDDPKPAQPAVPLAKPDPARTNTEKTNVPSVRGRALEFTPEAAARYREAIKPVNEAFGLAQSRYYAGDLIGAEQAARSVIPLAVGISPGAQADARTLIGKIRMRQGKYQEALDWIGADWQQGADSSLDAEVALCYVRLGNTTKARQFYSDEAAIRYDSSLTIQDLPGTRNRQMLEASILMARGLQKYATASGQAEALTDFETALQIVPNNGLAAYYAAKSLIALGRQEEAGPYFVKAVENGRGKFVENAKGWASTYLRNQALQKQKSFDQEQAVRPLNKP